MPRLPDVQGQSRSPVPDSSGSVVQLNLSDSSRLNSAAAGAISATGSELQEAANIIAVTNFRQDQSDAMNAANKLQEEAIKYQFDPNEGFQNARGEQAVGKKFTESYDGKFKAKAQQFRDGLANENQKKLFDKHAQVLGLQYQSGLLKHQAQETERFNDATDDSTINLQLRTMAQNPDNDLTFQTGIVKIEGTVDSLARRKGLPKEQADELKAKMLDAAYTTRITAIMDGVPGVVQADPYKAELMFKQVQGQMGPQAQTQLANQINRSVRDVQARDTAQEFVFKPAEEGGPPPSAKDLKVDLFQRVDAARKKAEEQRPGDTAYADAVASRVEGYARIVISNQTAQEAQARDSLVQGMMGPKPDGSQAPNTIDQLLANPEMKRAWDKSTPDARMAIQNHFKSGGGSPPRTPETQSLVYQYMGKAAMDRDGFANEDLSPLIAKLPFEDFNKIAALQMSARNKTERDADKAANLQHALSLSLNYALKPLGIGTPTANTSATKREQYEQFTGRLAQWMDDYKTANGKNPTDQDIVKQAKSLTATVQVPGMFWNSDRPGFTLTPEEEAKATVKLTPEQTTEARTSLKNRYGFEPTESMVQQAVILRRLYPNDLKRLRQFDETMREQAKKSKGGQW
jgi:hypothetical protein